MAWLLGYCGVCQVVTVASKNDNAQLLLSTSPDATFDSVSYCGFSQLLRPLQVKWRPVYLAAPAITSSGYWCSQSLNCRNLQEILVANPLSLSSLDAEFYEELNSVIRFLQLLPAQAQATDVARAWANRGTINTGCRPIKFVLVRCGILWQIQICYKIQDIFGHK